MVHFTRKKNEYVGCGTHIHTSTCGRQICRIYLHVDVKNIIFIYMWTSFIPYISTCGHHVHHTYLHVDGISYMSTSGHHKYISIYMWTSHIYHTYLHVDVIYIIYIYMRTSYMSCGRGRGPLSPFFLVLGTSVQASSVSPPPGPFSPPPAAKATYGHQGLRVRGWG